MKHSKFTIRDFSKIKKACALSKINLRATRLLILLMKQKLLRFHMRYYGVVVDAGRPDSSIVSLKFWKERSKISIKSSP